MVDTRWLSIHKALKVPLAKVPSSGLVHSSLYVNKSVMFLTLVECSSVSTALLSLTSTELSGRQFVKNGVDSAALLTGFLVTFWART